MHYTHRQMNFMLKEMLDNLAYIGAFDMVYPLNDEQIDTLIELEDLHKASITAFVYKRCKYLRKKSITGEEYWTEEEVDKYIDKKTRAIRKELTGY